MAPPSDSDQIQLDLNSTFPERPSKRIRLACEPCRRKKGKCPGEQPVCSLCARLRQRCVYDEERRRQLPPEGPSRSSIPPTPSTLEDRLLSLEGKLGAVLDHLGSNANSSSNELSTATPSGLGSTVILPTWEEIIPIAELYLLYCESQPLPLFHRETFLTSLQGRDIEIIYGILALSLRFSDSYLNFRDPTGQVNSYAEVARGLVMKRVSEGPVEISTLQCLCLLSLVDFTNGNTHRSSIHSSLAMNLAQCANLGVESRAMTSHIVREERRRCFWSICLLKRLHGAEFSILDLPEMGGPPYPQSPTRPARLIPSVTSTSSVRRSELQDQGIVAYVIMLSEVFSRTARYVRLRGRPGNVPPWSPESEYSKIMALQMNLETRMPLTHRFKPANLGERSFEELQDHREYWGPWFLNQFMYHTTLCLLNHPLLLSLSLRTFRSTIPEIFLQHTSDLISTHTTWIVHFIDYFADKGFLVSDPLLGYSAAVVATIELQLSFTEDSTIREKKRDQFTKCVKFVQQIGQKWPHMARLAQRLQHLEDAVSATYQSDPSDRNQSLLIDLSRFWEILEYASNSDADSARRLFGNSLYTGPSTAAVEVSQTSPLPAPTRLTQEEGSSHSQTRGYSTTVVSGAEYHSSVVSPEQLMFTNDELSILATNFFSQGQEFLRCGDTGNVGNF
ncbi:C6 transcription factor [Penicillium malachiteum]|uniref:C6 transcription factor n=1 Tax=Penicillium malachiteum TaxID=1324776 RepID=UPI00254944B1|nr:C6 transcription factor [Penicillium malachiteum]KAJ5726694.1 C6 transcription factor [Penicillium malachiteum]